MLKWLATQYERRRGALQARLEGRLRDKLASTPARQRSAELRRLGNECLAAGNLAEAEQYYRQGVAADPKDAACHSNLGYVLYEQGHRADAEESLEHAVKLDQSDYDAYYLLGNIARDRQETLRAIVCYRTALRLKPDFDFCRRDLCVALAQSGRIEEAQQVMNEGPAFEEGSATYHFFKGNLCMARNQLSEAVDCFRIAAELSPRDPTVLVNLCIAQFKRFDAFAALKTGQRILEIDPDNAITFSLMASTYQFIGRYDLTVEYYRKALELDPKSLLVHHNLLFALTYLPDLRPDEYLSAARAYSAKVSALATPFASWPIIQGDLDRRPLRVGFVSGDLCFHSVGLFLCDVLANLNPAQITSIAYSNRSVEDEYSDRLKSVFGEWNMVATWSDTALAHKIHDDQIDLLVDLSGHTGLNRLSVFAWRPAPVQVAWLGYWASTGLSEMDYLLVDRGSVHADESAHYSEKLWFLPDTRLCISESPVSAAVSPLPALTNGYITFGSFQTPSKVTDATLAVWAQVMDRLPTARLRLQLRGFEFAESVRRMHERLAAAKIDSNRVVLTGTGNFDAYLHAYSEVDIVLDTIPFPGGTTTFQALWMGVPTVTLQGNSLVTRQGESIVRCVGLSDWVADSMEDYARIAVQMATDLDALDMLRNTLRSKFQSSPLADTKRFASNLEVAFRGMYSEKTGSHV